MGRFGLRGPCDEVACVAQGNQSPPSRSWIGSSKALDQPSAIAFDPLIDHEIIEPQARDRYSPDRARATARARSFRNGP